MNASNNPVARARDAELAQLVAQVPPEVRAVIGRAALNSQRAINRWPYYSRVRFQAEILDLGGGAFQYNLLEDQTANAFNYGFGDSMQTAGFPASRLATLADTNIAESQKTKSGEDLWIYGISIYVIPGSEPTLVTHLFGQAQVTVQMNGGDDTYKLGPLIQIPASGGLFGAAPSALLEPPLMDTIFPAFGVQSNGLPLNTNYFRFPERIRWKPSGQRDSTLLMPFVNEQPFTIFANDRAADVPNGIAEFNAPTTVGQNGTFADLLVELHAESEYDRSANQ